MHPEEVAQAFLKALEARDLDAARAMTAPGFFMIFPGGARFTDFAELLAWAAPRYRRVAKRFDIIDSAETSAGTRVTIEGTLHGEWPDGTPFDGIRFIDRFLIKDGLIAEQHVWNDLGEVARR